jgi:hypothetical protein
MSIFVSIRQPSRNHLQLCHFRNDNQQCEAVSCSSRFEIELDFLKLPSFVFCLFFFHLKGICVANHTSPIDVLILACDNAYALVKILQKIEMANVQWPGPETITLKDRP